MANIGSQVSTGAKLILSINDKQVAYANNVTYTTNHNVQPVEVMGEEIVIEHAELGITVEFTASMFRVSQKAAISLGLMPKLSAFLTQPELVATIYDKVQDKTIMVITGLKCTSRAGTAGARDVANETLTFVGRRSYDEEGQ